MKKIILFFTLVIICVTSVNAYEVISGGPWNTIFGESPSSVEVKIRKINPNFDIKVSSNGDNIFVNSPLQIAGEIFDSGLFSFIDKKFKGCAFQKLIKYEYSFSNPLNYTQAEQWLINNRYKVNQMINPIKKLLSSKYGTPFKDSDDEIVWMDLNGNAIKLSVDQDSNIAHSDKEFTQKYGCVPVFSIMLLYIEESKIPSF